jgi:ketosteroid isomerase-like protein
VSIEHNLDTVRRFYELLARKEVEQWGELWHPEGTILIPYPPEGFADTLSGKETIVAAFHGLMANYDSFDSTLTALYPSADSESVVVEYTNDAKLLDGTVYTNSNIAVFRFTDGLVRWYHDYFDPRRFQVVVDALPSS